MNLASVADTRRGCGNLVKGGLYARGTFGKNGTLEAWTWCLGEGVIGGRNLNLSAPARQMGLIRLPETLFNRYVSSEPLPFTTDVLGRLPAFALLDHIGASFYTPWSFASEVKRLGPSRRVPEAMAATIARHLPMPILFTHSWMPVVDSGYQDELMKWAGAVGSWDISMTHDHPEWGVYAADRNHGEGHWLVPVLTALHRQCEGYKLIGNLPAELAENTLLNEQAFGISWITNVCYIVTGEEDEQTLERLLERGIEPVQIEGEDDDAD